MSAALVTVVMPCFNAAGHVAASIGSVQAQSLADWVLVAVDDGSTDGTAKVVQAIGDPRVRLIRQGNAGVSSARNRALAEVRTPYVAFLDADDSWAPQFLQTMVAALSSQPDAVVAYGGWEDVHQPSGRRLAHDPPDYEHTEDRAVALLQRCPWVIHAALARSESVQAVGGFDTRLTHSEDNLMWLRIAQLGRLVKVPGVLAYYHHDDAREQASRDLVRGVRQRRKALATFLTENPAIARRIGRQRRRELLYGQGRECAYDALWARDLPTAQALWRDCLRGAFINLRDLKYALAAVLPASLYRRLMDARDMRAARESDLG